ncbi:MAG: CAP domain-containing protein [Flavobacteriaceae bacterium]
MKMKLPFVMAVCFVLLASCGNIESTELTEFPSADNDKALENELLGIINAHRSSLGYSPLQFSSVAYQYANNHTDYMISQGGLSHDNFNARASSISSEADAEMVAENVAKDYANAAAAFEGWLESADHRQTMEGDFTHTALSVKKDVQGTYFYTQLFYR